MSKIGLEEVMEALQAELAATAKEALAVQLEFQGGVTCDEETNGRIKFWVLDLRNLDCAAKGLSAIPGCQLW